MLADVSDIAEVEAVVARAVERFGRLDVLISNAGVLAPNGRIHNLTDRGLGARRSGSTSSARSTASAPRSPVDARAAVGLDRPHRVGRRAHRVVARGAVLRDQGGGDPAREGRGGRVRPRRHPGELRVPGHVPAPASTPSLPQEAIDAIAAKHPLGLGAADDLVGAYSYLASDASRWTTGSAIVVDGGYAAP